MRRLNNNTITTQPSNDDTSKISSRWRQTIKDCGEEEEGNKSSPSPSSFAQISTTKTTTCITTDAGRDDVETAYHDNNNIVRRTQQEQPYIMMFPSNSNHLRTSSSSKQRVSYRDSDRKYDIGTSIVAGLILLFSVSMFLVYNNHINISIDITVNLAARKNNQSNKYVKEEDHSSSSASLVKEVVQSSEQSVELEETQYPAAVKVLDDDKEMEIKMTSGVSEQQQSEGLHHETLAVLVSGAGSSEVNGCYLPTQRQVGDAWQFELIKETATFEMFKVEGTGRWIIQGQVGDLTVYYGVEGDRNAVLPPTDGWRSTKFGLSWPDWDKMPNVLVTNRKVCLSRTIVEPSAALTFIQETLNDPKNHLNGCDFSDFIRRFKPEELDISCDNISELVLGKLAGKGSVREVYEATLHGRKVAVKQRIPDTGQSSMWDVLKEVSVLFQLRESENVAKLVGWCNHTIITEYAPRTLEALLPIMLDKKEKIPVPATLSLGLDVVRALAQLHSVAGGPVAHNDLHLGQFLINSEGRALLQDMHEVEYTGKYHANSDGQSGKCLYRTWPRGAPEKFVQERVVSESGDVYEVAHVLWSIMANYTYQYDRTKAGTRPDLSLMKGYPQDMKDLIAEAWNDDPLQRPKATELVERVESILQNYNHKAMLDAAMPYSIMEEETLG